jgi:hypothetical protein
MPHDNVLFCVPEGGSEHGRDAHKSRDEFSKPDSPCLNACQAPWAIE